MCDPSFALFPKLATETSIVKSGSAKNNCKLSETQLKLEERNKRDLTNEAG